MRKMSSIVVLILLTTLILPVAQLPSTAAEKLTGTETVAIDEDKYESFGMGGQGDIRFSVIVVEGGNVDVYVCDSPPTLGSLEYIDGYDYIDVEYVEDSFSRDDDNTMFIVVDNGDNVGVASTGDVTVTVAWTTEKISPPEDPISILPAVLIVGFFVVLIIVVLVARVRRGRAMEPQVIIENVYVDEQGRQVAAPRTPMMSAQDKWCPRCGSERRMNPATGRPYCPSCTPPPPPPG